MYLARENRSLTLQNQSRNHVNQIHVFKLAVVVVMNTLHIDNYFMPIWRNSTENFMTEQRAELRKKSILEMETKKKKQPHGREFT